MHATLWAALATAEGGSVGKSASAGQNLQIICPSIVIV